ncbi:MAG: methyltransferase domain-containing protein [Patescibacteria group bacterium]|nr:methyltransferase domain-containing protein [Patescibacteria group bacterium]
MERKPDKPQIYAGDIWKRFGITEHYGGYFATEELIKRCGIWPLQDILIIGCGTGYTPVLLAKEYNDFVMATDIDPRMLELTRERIIKEGVGAKVKTQLADVQNLPFKDNTYNVVLAESVLVFTDPLQSAREMLRVLKPGGVFGVNEVTVVGSPPAKSIESLTQFYPSKVQILSENEWRHLFEEAGFDEVTSIVHKLNYWKQLLSHLKIDGPRKYLASVYHMIADSDLRSIFFNKGLLWDTISLMSYMSYGLYTGKKP